MDVRPISRGVRCERCAEHSPAGASFCIGCGAGLGPDAPSVYTGETQPLRWPDPDEPDDRPGDHAARAARALGVPRPIFVGAVVVLLAAVALQALLAHAAHGAIFERVMFYIGG